MACVDTPIQLSGLLIKRYEVRIHMLTRTKQIALAAVVAAATTFGSGQAWALDVSPSNTVDQGPPSGWPAVTGCDGGLIGTSSYGSGASLIVTMSIANLSVGSVNFVQIEFDSAENLVNAVGFAPSDTDPFMGFNFVELLCPNLSNVTTVSANSISDPVAYSSASFVGNIFEADDANDGTRYRYFVGFEGVTESVRSSVYG